VALLFGQFQGIGQGKQGLAVGRAIDTAFEIGEAAWAEVGALGQLGLREPGLAAKLTEGLPKGLFIPPQGICVLQRCRSAAREATFWCCAMAPVIGSASS
jgi:hypothetical protein